MLPPTHPHARCIRRHGQGEAQLGLKLKLKGGQARLPRHAPRHAPRGDLGDPDREFKLENEKLSEVSNAKPQTELNLADSARTYTSIVAVSGAGKTRLLLEHAYKTFGVHLVATTRGNSGSIDLQRLLQDLPGTVAPEPESVESVYQGIKSYMLAMVLARILVLAHLIQLVPGFLLRHWLERGTALPPPDPRLGRVQRRRRGGVERVAAHDREGL